MRTVITVIISLIIGIAVGVLGTIFVYPFIFPPPQVNESVQNVQTKILIAHGKFIHPNPADRLHWGKGHTKIYRHPSNNANEVLLDKTFQVGPGPAFYLYLSQDANIKKNKDFRQAKHFELGPLKSFKGSQVYKIPASIDMNKIKSVVVWCKSFGQLITSANLQESKKSS